MMRCVTTDVFGLVEEIQAQCLSGGAFEGEVYVLRM